MKVLIASFTSESNAAVRQLCTIDRYILKYGKDVEDAHGITGIFEDAGIETIPVFYAMGHAAGLVDPEAFSFIKDQILKGVREHLNEIDGIYLHLHGASGVKGLPESSGDHVILREVRRLVGNYLPIAVVMDPHGNVTEEFCRYANIVRCYRQSPHTDNIETHQIVARKLIELMKNRAAMGDIHPAIHKLPLMLGGERCVSADEPLRTINQKLDELEKDPHVLSDSYHVGYLRHDDDKAGAAVVVVPRTEADYECCQKKADELAAWVWDHRRDFHFTGIADEPDASLKRCLEAKGMCVLTDSGDNMTSGARGFNTYVLRQCLSISDYGDKKILLCPIYDPKANALLASHQVGDTVEFDLGVNEDELSAPVHIRGAVTAYGEQHNPNETDNMGPAITVQAEGKPVSVTVVGQPIYYTQIAQLKASNINIFDYNLVVVKQGYIFPELKKIADFYIMSLTDGPTNQRTERMTYRRIPRPMFPIDEI